MMKKLILILCCFLAFTSCKEEKKLQTKSVVKIGAILPLSGDMAVWGNSEKQGMILAKENLSKNLKYDYELYFEDSVDENKSVRHLAQKLININKVDALVTMFDPPANITGPIASENKILHFGQSWFPAYVNDEYNYNVYANMQDEARLIADYLKYHNIKRVHLFTVNQTGFINGTNILKDFLKEREIDYQETFFNFGAQDFKMDIAKTKSFAPEAYVIGAFAPEADILTKQLKQIVGENVRITGLDLGLNVANRALYEGSVFAMPALPKDAFLKQYKERFGDDNYLYGAMVGFVSFNAIVKAYENAHQTNHEDVAKFLNGISDVQTLYDQTIQKQGGMIYLPSELMMIENNELVKFEE